MKTGDFDDLPKLFLSPTEKFMDDFVGIATELRGLFKVHASKVFAALRKNGSKSQKGN